MSVIVLKMNLNIERCFLLLCVVSAIVLSLPTKKDEIQTLALGKDMPALPRTPVLAEMQANSQEDTLESIKDKEGMEQLQEAWKEIKVDIVAKSHQAQDEKKWVDQVKDIIDTYKGKMDRVVGNVGQLRKSIRDLYVKKRQIENLMLQKKLENKLQDASSDLGTLTKALAHVAGKADTFKANKKNVEDSIASIKMQLSKLRGEDEPKEAAEGKSGDGESECAQPCADE